MHGPSDKGPPDDDGGGESNRPFVIALVFVAALAIAGVLVVRALVDMVRLQDCAVTGRRNC